MRKTGVLLLVLLGLVALAAPARATVIAADSFTYAAGTIVGQAGGTGWTGAWGGNNSVQVVSTPSTPLSFGNINGGNKSLVVWGANNNVAYRTFPTQFDTLYMRYLFRYTSSQNNGNEFAALWIDNNPPVEPTHSFKRVNMGLKMDRGPAPGTEDLMGRFDNTSTSEVYSPLNLNVGETYLLVGKLYKSVPGSLSPYDRFAFWVNPTGSEGSPLGVSSISGTTTSSFYWLGVRTANLPTGLAVWMDEMMLATSWNDVVPEPSSAIMSLLVLGAGYLVRRRVRK